MCWIAPNLRKVTAAVVELSKKKKGGNLMSAIMKSFSHRHRFIRHEHCEPIPDSHSELKESECFMAGFCVCTDELGRKAKRIRRDCHRVLKLFCPAKSQLRDDAKSCELFLRFSAEEEESEETVAKMWHISYFSLSPFEMTVQNMIIETEDRKGRPNLIATGVWLKDWNAALSITTLLGKWQVQLYRVDLCDAPLASFDASEVSAYPVLGKGPVPLSLQRGGGGDDAPRGRRRRQAQRPAMLAIVWDSGDSTSDDEPRPAGGGGDHEPAPGPGAHFKDLHDLVAPPGADGSVADLEEGGDEPGSNSEGGSDGVVEEDDLNDGQDGGNDGRGGRDFVPRSVFGPREDASLTLRLPSGAVLSYYDKHEFFSMRCPNRDQHGYCCVKRTSKARGIHNSQGRPLGLLMLWAETHDQQTQHVHLIYLSTLWSHERRLAARIRLAAIEGSADFFQKERDSWDHENSPEPPSPHGLGL